MIKNDKYKKISHKIFSKSNLKFIKKKNISNKTKFILNNNNISTRKSFIIKKDNFDLKKNSTKYNNETNDLDDLNKNLYQNIKSNMSNYSLLANSIEINHIYKTNTSNTNLIFKSIKIKIVNLANKIEKEYMNFIKYNEKNIKNKTIIEEILKNYNEIVFEILKYFKGKNDLFNSNCLEILWNFIIFLFDKINKLNNDYNDSIFNKFLNKKISRFEDMIEKKNIEIDELKNVIKIKKIKIKKWKQRLNCAEDLYEDIKEELIKHQSVLKQKSNQDPFKLINSINKSIKKNEININKAINENLIQTKIISNDFTKIIAFASKKNFYQENKDIQTFTSFNTNNFYLFKKNINNIFDKPDILVDLNSFEYLTIFNSDYKIDKKYFSQDLKSFLEIYFNECFLNSYFIKKLWK